MNIENQNEFEMVEAFHNAYDCPVYNKPTLPSYECAYEEVEKEIQALSWKFQTSNCDSRTFLRMKLIFEEFKELCEAMRDGNFVGIVDGLTDLRYVVYGTYHEFGLGPIAHKAFCEVHRSNMSKLGVDGKPIKREDGKVLKGPNFTPPELWPILLEAYK